MQFPYLTVLLAAAGLAAAVPVEGSGVAPLEARQLQLPLLSCPKTKLLGLIPIGAITVTSTCSGFLHCLPPATKPTKFPGLDLIALSDYDLFGCSACTCKGGSTGTPEVPAPGTGGRR